MTYLYFWGGDKFLHKKDKNSHKKEFVINNAHGIINIIPQERKYMKDNYQIKGKYFVAHYRDEGIVSCLKKYHGNISNKQISIQVGNSATKTNYHMYILKKLKKYKAENIRIYVPLSYGDEKYAQKIVKKGQKMFGDKFVGITSMMNQEEYYKFMSKMDVGIFYLKRQQAMGNIHALLYYGKKVYLKRNSILAHFYKKSLGCDISYIEDIDSMKFEEFICFEVGKMRNNFSCIDRIININFIIDLWKKVFEDEV